MLKLSNKKTTKTNTKEKLHLKSQFRGELHGADADAVLAAQLEEEWLGRRWAEEPPTVDGCEILQELIGGLSMLIPLLIGFQHVSTIQGDVGFRTFTVFHGKIHGFRF